jgi:AcrR family transcriptional regulator
VTERGDNYGGRTREERATDRRDRIVAAALGLFGTRNYDSVTVADVCAGAKVSKRYFYEHFADRDALLLTLHREQNNWLLTGVAAAAPSGPAPLDDLLRPIMRTLIALLREHPERARVIYVNAPRMETRRRGLLRKDAEFFGRLISQATPKPQDRLWYDRRLLALVAGVTEVVIDWLARDMTDDPDLLADHLTRLGTAILTDP